MFVTINRIFVKPEFTEAFERLFQSRARQVDQQPGFVRNLVLRPRDPATTPYLVITFWQSRADFETWVQSPAFQKGHARSRSLPPDAFYAPNQLETFEVLQDTDTR